MKIFNLPDLGEGLPDAIIREWYVKVGDTVKTDDPLVAMETAKALVDLPAPYAGTVEKLFGHAGDTIDTGKPLIGFEGEGDAAPSDKGTVVGNLQTSGSIQEQSSLSARSAPTGAALKATPAVRMLARQLNVDLTTLTPSGPHITADDVKAAARIQTQASSTLTGPAEKLSGVRRAMAISMAKAQQEVAAASLMDEADLHAWAAGQDTSLRLLRALAHACQTVPLLNSYYDHSQMAIQQHEQIHVGLAVDTPHGLYVPVLHDVGNRSDAELRADINRYKEQAQSHSIPQKDLQGATILMSNVGVIAGQYAVPVVTPPMVAIVAFGRMKPTVFMGAEGPETHRLLPISLTFDHRPVTGGDAARFLRALIEHLQQPTG